MSLTAVPHRHTFYEVLYYKAGKGTHFIDFVPYPLNPPVFFFISPGQVHFWKIEEPLKGKMILFTEDFMVLNPLAQSTIEELPFFYKVMHKPELQITQAQKEFLEVKMEEMEQEFSLRLAGRSSALRASLNIFLIHLLRMYTSLNPNDAHSPECLAMVRKLKKLIAENPVINHPVAVYAEKLNTSSAHLNETVKKVTGLSCGKLIHSVIALEAKRLLVHSQMSAAEIGYKLKFDDPSYFGRFFKRETGKSPRAFRNEIMEKYQFFLG